MTVELTAAQNRFLRGQAHELRALLQVTLDYLHGKQA